MPVSNGLGTDYLPNLRNVDRFPFSLYHVPIRSHVLRLIKEREQSSETLSILNVGCGLSQILNRIDERHEYCGVDVDSRAIERCEQLYRHRRATFDTSEPYTLPCEDDKFDIVFATEVVEHVLEPEKWLEELARVTKPGGHIQLSTPNYGGWLLPLIESTFLELMARLQGFTRKGIHPTKFDDTRLSTLLQRCGLVKCGLAKTPGRLALIGTGQKPSE